MELVRTRIEGKGRVVIPSSFRSALGLNVGDEVDLRIEDGEIRISTFKSRLDRARKQLRKFIQPGGSLVDELIAERREAAKRE